MTDSIFVINGFFMVRARFIAVIHAHPITLCLQSSAIVWPGHHWAPHPPPSMFS
jgi:hypothetical protein